MNAIAGLAGLLMAASLITAAYALRPPRLRLDLALARIQPTSRTPRPPQSSTTMRERLSVWPSDHVAKQRLLTIPRTDLALMQRSIERIMLEKLALVVTGLTLPLALWTALTLAGLALPWGGPTVAGLLLAVALFFLPDLTIRSAARRRRQDFRDALTCYLQLIVLERQAGASVNAALERTARVADCWPFQRIADALARARRAQQPPWRALADLGEQIGVHDLVDLAYTAEIAGEHGARMHDVLTAKVTAMHHEASATARSMANVRTTTMWVPTSLLMLGYVILIGFPFLYRLIQSG